MKVEKIILASLPGAYVVRWGEFEGKLFLLAATEQEGPCLKISFTDCKVETLCQGPGGVMSLWQVPGMPRMLAGIGKFFPVFQSENAGIFILDMPSGEKRRIADLPFVHRIEFLKAHDGTDYLLAATLCGGKEYRDDWTQPGAVYAGVFDAEKETVWRPEIILEGIHKNHGMTVNGSEAFISAEEGIFSIEPPPLPSGRWRIEKIMDKEISDLMFADLDDDGVQELVTIEPFHGDTVGIYRRKKTEWNCVRVFEGEFIHALWAGGHRNPGVLFGCREGRKELVFLRLSPRDSWAAEPLILDEGVGSANVSVFSNNSRLLVASANHASGEIALYTIDC